MFGLDLNLNWDEFDIWPAKIKVGIIVLLCSVLAGLSVWYDLKPLWQTLENEKTQELSLKGKFKGKQMKAARLGQYREHLKEIRIGYNDMVQRLPNKAEVASLLAEISQTGISNNLEFKLFKPEREVPMGFYSELPIKIRVTGHYHDFGRFAGGLAALPRTVILNNVFIKQKKDASSNLLLQIDATVKTYRYIGDDDAS